MKLIKYDKIIQYTKRIQKMWWLLHLKTVNQLMSYLARYWDPKHRRHWRQIWVGFKCIWICTINTIVQRLPEFETISKMVIFWRTCLLHFILKTQRQFLESKLHFGAILTWYTLNFKQHKPLILFNKKKSQQIIF